MVERDRGWEALLEENRRLRERISELDAVMRSVNAELERAKEEAREATALLVQQQQQAALVASTRVLEAEIVRRQAETEALFQAAKHILESQEFKTTARNIFDTACALTGAESGYVALLSDNGTENEVLFLEAGDLQCSVDPSLPMPIRGLRESAYRTNRVVFENDFMRSEWASLMPPGHVALRNVLFVPLNVAGKTVGIMGIANKPTAFDSDDVRITEALGNLASIALSTHRNLDLLRDSEERLRLANKATNDVVWDWDVAHDTQQWNEAGTKVFGWTDIVERPQTAHWWVERVHPDDRKRVDESFFTAVDDPARDQWQDEYRFLRANGTYADVLDRGYIMRDAQGKAIRMIGAMLDISERKQIEKEHLEMERRLQHAQRLESLGVLAGGIAHDFNNLLQILLGNASFAKNACKDNQVALKHLADIDLVVKRAASLIKQMLAYAGKGTYRIEVVGFSKFCTETVHLMRASISKKAILALKIEPDLKINADTGQLSQVLMNLIINASEALGDRAGEIRIRAYNVALDEHGAMDFSQAESLPAGSYVRLEVSDTGCGMDEATLAKIFDPFFTTKFTGRGLGLPAVQGIVRGHKGAIRVESQPGKGTTFTILLPVSEDTPKKEAGSLPATTPRKGCRGTILVVDDEEMLRGLLKVRFEDLGFRVLDAEDGQEALEVYRRHGKEISLVLLDYKMPKLDGVEAFIEMKKINAGVAAILSSGYGEEEAIDKQGPLGWAGFIQKPYDMDELMAKVQALLGQDAQ